PSPAERIDNVSNLIAEFPPQDGLKQDSVEFQRAKDLMGRGSGPLFGQPAGPGSGPLFGQPAGPPLAEGKSGARVETPVASTVASSVASTEAVTKPGVSKPSADGLLRISGMTYPGSDRDRQVAEAFAPIITQGLSDPQRFDYITNFDFDGDWRGDNNWEN